MARPTCYERCRRCRRACKPRPDRLCHACRAAADKRVLFRRGEKEAAPPPAVDPGREARIARYRERAALRLPLFASTSTVGVSDAG